MYLDLKIMSNFYNQEQDRYPTKQCEREARAQIFNIVAWKGTYRTVLVTNVEEDTNITNQIMWARSASWKLDILSIFL